MQMKQRWSSLPRMPLRTRGSWVRNALAMVDGVVELVIRAFESLFNQGIYRMKKEKEGKKCMPGGTTASTKLSRRHISKCCEQFGLCL